MNVARMGPWQRSPHDKCIEIIFNLKCNLRMKRGFLKKWIFLLRAFFPSWRFFDDVGAELRLEVRSGDSAQKLGEWRSVLAPIPRSMKNIFLNPKGNDLHACHNLLIQLNSDIQEFGANVIQRPSFALTRNLAREQRDSQAYQFRLTVMNAEEALLSPVYAE
jgi:hypothetical protein